MGEPALDLEPGMPSWLLARDGAAGRRAQLAFRDYNSLYHFCGLARTHAKIDRAFAAQTYVKQNLLCFEHEQISQSDNPSEKYRLHTSLPARRSSAAQTRCW